jgi:hypothetical protein
VDDPDEYDKHVDPEWVDATFGDGDDVLDPPEG